MPNHPVQGAPNNAVSPPIQPDRQVTAAVVAGAALANGDNPEAAVAAGIATAGFVGTTNTDLEYQRAWKARRAEARGWKKVWAFIWG